MPKIEIKKSTNFSAKATFDKVESFLKDDPDLRKMDSSYQCQFDSAKLTGNLKGKQFEGQFHIQEIATSSSQVIITVQIPLLLTPLKGAIESTLNKKLDRLLA